ncbi:MAG: 2-oxo acid dehydrogenase subunit E2 [Haloarculaceae archaeon]
MTDDGPASRTVSEEHALKGMRKTIASRLQESYQEAVHVTASREVAAGALLAAAEVADVSVTDVLLCALSETLGAHPPFNATFEDGTHRIYEEHNVAIAVDVDAGLVTPVVADVGAKSLGEVAAERRRLTEAVRAGEHSMNDLRGSTFTLSNLGPLGVDSFTPVINPPEVAILGVGRIVDRARPERDDGAVRKRLTLDLSFDHRVVDGADAARFLETLAGRIESAEQYVES